MPRQRTVYAIFNRGLISDLALARTDVARIAMSASIQSNWIPRTLGPMSLRPGLEFIGELPEDASLFPFLFSANDTAIIELSPDIMRIWDGGTDLVTAPTPSATINNPNFADDLGFWSNADESGASSAWVSGGRMGLTGTGYNAAIRRQEVTASDDDLEQRLRIVINRGPVVLRVGTAAGSDNLMPRTELGTGHHSIAFTPPGDTYWVEFSNRRKHRVEVTQCRVEDAGVVELPTPWFGPGRIRQVRMQQSYDVIWCAQANTRPMQIERRDNNSWSIADYQTEDGPFRIENLERVRISADAITGTVTLTASQRIFQTDNIGSLWRLTSAGQIVTSSLSADATWTNSVKVVGVEADRRIRYTISGTWNGTVSLQRSLGEEGAWTTVEDQTGNVVNHLYNDQLDNAIAFYRLGFDSAEYTSGTAICTITCENGSIVGVVRIISYTDRQHVDAVVLADLGGTGETEIWAEGAWSERRGFPSAVALYEGRLWWARAGYIWASVSGAFESFNPDYEGDAGPISRFLGEGPVGSVHWLLPAQRLIAGTDMAEHSIRSSSLDEPVTPSNYNAKQASTQGCRAIAPAKMDKKALFAQRNGQRVYEMDFDLSKNDYESADLTVLCPEVLEPLVLRIAIQRKPDTRVHCVLGDGTVALLVRDAAEDVQSWNIVQTDGLIEDACVLTKAGEDEVFYSVARAGGIYLERWAAEADCRGGAINKQADSFRAYVQSPAGTLCNELEHIEGEEVVMWGDGEDLGTATVTGGAVTLPVACFSAVVGLGYEARYQSSKLALREVRGALGSPLTRRKSINQLALILKDTHYQGLQFGTDFNHLQNLPVIVAEAAADGVWANYDDDAVPFSGVTSTDARICLRAAAPRPCTVLAAVLEADSDD